MDIIPGRDGRLKTEMWANSVMEMEIVSRSRNFALCAIRVITPSRSFESDSGNVTGFPISIGFPTRSFVSEMVLFEAPQGRSFAARVAVYAVNRKVPLADSDEAFLAKFNRVFESRDKSGEIDQKEMEFSDFVRLNPEIDEKAMKSSDSERFKGEVNASRRPTVTQNETSFCTITSPTFLLVGLLLYFLI